MSTLQEFMVETMKSKGLCENHTKGNAEHVLKIHVMGGRLLQGKEETVQELNSSGKIQDLCKTISGKTILKKFSLIVVFFNA